MTSYCFADGDGDTLANHPDNNIKKTEVAAGGSSAEVTEKCEQVVRVEGLDSGTVVGIAFAAFIIGVLLTAALWYIHTHTGMLHWFARLLYAHVYVKRDGVGGGVAILYYFCELCKTRKYASHR